MRGSFGSTPQRTQATRSGCVFSFRNDRPARPETKILALVSTGHFFSHIYLIALPPLFPLLEAELGVGYAALGLLLALPNLATMVL